MLGKRKKRNSCEFLFSFLEVGEGLKKYEKEVLQAQLEQEKKVLKKLEENYADALAEINDKIANLLARQDANLAHVVYQVEFQKSLKKQVEVILESLRNNEFETISEYLTYSYEEGFVGAMYSMQQQGIPLVIPIDQEQIVAAIQHETKLSENLYTALGRDTKDLSKKIAGEISRGISGGMMYSEIARNIVAWGRIPKNNAMRIARTEAHRIQTQAAMDAQFKARDKGAEVVKQWDSSLDARTRDSHVRVDGEIRELDEKFSNGLLYPGDPSGRAAEVINCRCALLQRAKWALGEEELNTLKERADFFGLDRADSFEDYKKKYMQASERMKLSFPDDVYKIKGFTESVKNEVDAAMEKLNNEYEIRLNSIVVEPAEKGDIFVVGYHDGVVDMVVNENADFEKIKRRIFDKYKSGEYAGKSLEDYLAHEIAHCMLYQDCKTDAEYRAKYQQIESLYSSLKGISHYADKKQSGNEALAEAFVRVRNGEKVSPIVRVLVDTYFGRWKK